VKRTLPSQFKIDGRIVFDPNEIVHKFCKYFTNIGTIWQIKYLQLVHLFEHALVQVFSETIWLKPATLAELEQTCMTFKSGKVPGFKQYTHAYY
jgi:hypothetical protein